MLNTAPVLLAVISQSQNAGQNVKSYYVRLAGINALVSSKYFANPRNPKLSQNCETLNPSLSRADRMPPSRSCSMRMRRRLLLWQTAC